MRSKLLAEKLIENFSTHLGALAERDSGLRSDDARFRLPLAETLDSATMSLAAKWAWLALICDFGGGCEPTFGSKTKTTPSQNIIRRTNHIAQPTSVRQLVE